MSKRIKNLMIDELARELRKSESCVLLGLNALDVTTTTEFRADLRSKGVRVRVLKNRIAAHAAKTIGWDGMGDLMEGMSAVAYGEGGAIAASKLLVSWERKFPAKIKIRGGYLDGRILDKSQVQELATIPDRATLYSMIAAAVVAPMSQITGLIGEMLSGIARAVGAAADKAGKSE
jgi:large subunit ribosomal protein L10